MNAEQSAEALPGRHSRKRPHHEIEDSESDGQPEPAWAREGPSSTPYQGLSTTPGAPLNLPHLRQMRLPGYDYRRPIMSTGTAASRDSPIPSHSFRPTAPPQDNVIDLTDEPDQPTTQTASSHTPRPPRFGRDIMTDVVDLENGNQPSPSSPEVQFMGVSTRPRSPRRPQPIEPEVQGPHGLGAGSNDDVLSHSRPSNRDLFALLRRSRSRSSRTEHPVAREIRLRNRHFAPIFRQDFGGFWLGSPPQNPGMDLTIDIDEDEPVQVTYSRPMVPQATQTAPSAATATPGYTGPTAAPEGFTRNPDNITVCPNCDFELGTGDDPVRRQIWVAKPCGHVYCGQCTKNRALSRGKKQAPRERAESKPFSKCVVSGCEKSVSQPKAMFQIYL